MGSSFIHLIRTDSNVLFFNDWVIFHCVYVPMLPYPIICWWASRLLPCPGYYKQCCDEHWGARASFRSGFLGVYAQEWYCLLIWQFYFQFFFPPMCTAALFIYLFISFIFISWRLITLQYCSGFCHTLTWISHGFPVFKEISTLFSIVK